jgi:multiple sugar transport system permease protein
LLILPALLLIAGVVVYPLVSNVIISLQTDYRAIQQGATEWVGFANFRNAWNQGLMQVSMKNSFFFTISCVVLAFVLGFISALLLNELTRMQSPYRVLIVLPWVISPVIAGFTWRWLLNDQFGYLNAVLIALGIIRQPIIWLGDTRLAFLAIIMAGTWRIFPFVTIMLLAGLQAVSKELLEAAQIDGAGPWQKFVSVTVPQVRSVIVVVVLLDFIWMFNEFGIVQVMTQGGPLNSTMVLPVLIRTLTFKHMRMGTASALSLMLALILLILSVIYLQMVERETD